MTHAAMPAKEVERFTITDEFLEKLKHPKSVIRIHGQYYAISDDREFKVGDVVLDRKDGCHGIIDMIQGDLFNHAAVRNDFVVEVGIPLRRLVKLKKGESGN